MRVNPSAELNMILKNNYDILYKLFYYFRRNRCFLMIENHQNITNQVNKRDTDIRTSVISTLTYINIDFYQQDLQVQISYSVL